MDIMSARFTPSSRPKVSDELWEEIIAKFPSGQLPVVDHCYCLRFETMFGEPFYIPDFVLTNNIPVGWKSAKPKDLVAFRQMLLAPNRGSRLRQRLQSYFLQKLESVVGYVAWRPHDETSKPWMFKGLMPDFKFGNTPDEAMRGFL